MATAKVVAAVVGVAIVVAIVIGVAIAVILALRPYPLPRIIWCHWNIRPLPSMTAEHWNQIRNLHPTKDGWEIRELSDANLQNWIHAFPEGYDKLSLQHKADWIRLYILERYGGCWVDAGIWANHSFAPIWEETRVRQAELTAFWLDSKQYVENWFLIAPAESRIVSAWRKEFERAISMGFLPYRRSLEARGVNLTNIFQDKDDTYLTMHAAMRYIQQTMNPDLLLYRAEDTMFKIHDECNWEDNCMRPRFRQMKMTAIPWIKLRGSDRNLLI